MTDLLETIIYALACPLVLPIITEESEEEECTKH